MNPEDFSPVPFFSFRLVAFWFKQRFNVELKRNIDKQYIEEINRWTYDRVSEFKLQSTCLKSMDYRNIIKTFSQKENFYLEDYEKLFKKNVSRWSKEKDKVRKQQFDSRMKELKEQLNEIPIVVTDKYVKYYDDLYYFVHQLIKLGYYEIDFEDSIDIAFKMHEQLCYLERYYIHDLNREPHNAVWEMNLKLVTNFLEQLNPRKMNPENYEKIVSSVLYYFSTDPEFVKYLKYEEPYFEIIYDNNSQNFNLVMYLYKPLKDMAKAKNYSFEFVNEREEVEKITRDKWVCKFYNSLVNIKNMEFRKRGLTLKINTIKPSTLKSIASRFDFIPKTKYKKKIYEKKFAD
jgi:hypothetical protein